jgi:hypothetical protein
VTKALIRVPIVYQGRYCDEQSCLMWDHRDQDIYPHCAAFGSLTTTRGDFERGRRSRSIRDAECVKATKAVKP